MSAIEAILRDSLLFNKEKVSVEYFVPNSDEKASENQKAFALVLQAALASAADEQQLQDAVFSALEKHPKIEIMEESKKKHGRSHRKESSEQKKKKEAKEKKRRDFVANTRKFFEEKAPRWTNYAEQWLKAFLQIGERDTKNLLDLYANNYIKTVCQLSTKMKEAEPGLFVKTSSRPDIVAMIKDVNDMLFAEIKNDNNYSDDDAVEQEICYLMLLLYWWRVVCGRDVEKVCGFTICGPRCKSNSVKKRKWFQNYSLGPEEENMYHISLIEVSIPEKLGQLNTAKIWQKRYKVLDPTGLNTLYKFLSSKDLWNNVGKTPQLEPLCRAWMTLPRGFSNTYKNALNWKLVPGGTSAVVIRCVGTAGVLSFLNSDIVDSTLQKSGTKRWLKGEEKLDTNSIFYVKVKTKATERLFLQNPLTLWDYVKEQQQEMDQDQDVYKRFLETYPCRPVQIQTGDYYAVLMRDRGSKRLDDSDALKGITDAEFAERLWALWQETNRFSTLSKVCHGDVADFNILIHDKTGEFVLIDWDEASKLPKSRHIRDTDLRGEMKHHEALRSNQALYTSVQFALTYCELRDTWYEKKTWNVKTNKSLEGFRNAIGSRDKDLVAEEAQAFVEAVESEMKCKFAGQLLEERGGPTPQGPRHITGGPTLQCPSVEENWQLFWDNEVYVNGNKKWRSERFAAADVRNGVQAPTMTLRESSNVALQIPGQDLVLLPPNGGGAVHQHQVLVWTRGNDDPQHFGSLGDALRHFDNLLEHPEVEKVTVMVATDEERASLPQAVTLADKTN